MRILVVTINSILAVTMITSCGTGNEQTQRMDKVIDSGERARFTYDSNDRVTAITGPGTRKLELDYDERGRLPLLSVPEPGHLPRDIAS